MKNQLCLKNNSQCPISYIKIKDINSPPPNITYLKSIENEKIRFYYSNDPYADTSEIPYIQNSFKIADDEICALPNLYYSKSDFFILDIMKKELSSDCVLKDYSQNITKDKLRYHELNSINQYELYNENGIIDIITRNNLNDYGFNVEKYKENTLHLFINSHFGFNKTCLKKRKTEIDKELSEINSTSENMFFWGNFIFWLYIASLGLIISELVNIFKCNGCDINIENLIKNIVNNLLSIIAFLYSIIWGLSYDNFYEENMECSDFVSNSNYNVMIYKIQKNGKNIKICCFLLLVFLFLNLFSFAIFIIQCSCNDYCSEYCGRCCCICCIKCCFEKNKNDGSSAIQLEGASLKDKTGNKSVNQNEKPVNNAEGEIQKNQESSKDVIIQNKNSSIFKNKV